MSDLNHMSLADLVRFAEQKHLPTEVGSQSDALKRPADWEDEPAEEVLDENEASAEELLAMLGDTIATDELDSSIEDSHKDAAKNIDKMKIRQLANEIQRGSPPKLFDPKRDEIYYFLTAMIGQTPVRQIEDAEAKCNHIEKSLNLMQDVILSEIGMDMDEYDSLIYLIDAFADATIGSSRSRKRIKLTFKSGWRQSLNLLAKDVSYLQKYAKERNKPIWIVIKYYESLNRAFKLCQADADLAEHSDIQVGVTKDEHRAIVSFFEDLVEVSPFYGFRKLVSVDRKGVFLELEKMQMDSVVELLKERARQLK